MHGKTRLPKRRSKPAGLPAKQAAREAASADNPLCGVALLKIAMELKKPGAAPLEQVISKVLSRMGLREEVLRSYLAHEDLLPRLGNLKPR